MVKTKHYNYNILDFLLLIAIVFQYAKEIPFIHLAVNTTAILCMGIILFYQIAIKRNTVSIPVKLLILLAYMGIITFTQYHDFLGIKNFCLFAFFIVTITLYFLSENDKEKILSIIYVAAVILSVYAIIQELGYILAIPEIYDPTMFGFKRFYVTEIGGNLIASYSLYDEPSHLASVQCGGIMIGAYKKWQGNNHYPFTRPYLTALLVLVALLSASATVFICLFFSVLIILIHANVPTKIKLIIIASFFIAVCLFFIIFPTAFEMVVMYRIMGLFTQFYTSENPTIFAIASNIRYAIAKICDGHFLGTGYDSNRYYYREYIDQLYHITPYYLNEEDAASIFTRILSEFGIVGLVCMVGYLLKRAIKNIKKNDWIVTSMISMFLFQGARNGQYYLTMMVIPTVFLLYYDTNSP